MPTVKLNKPQRLRPSTGMVLNAVFSMLGADGVVGMRVLDLYAGTGAFGIRALQTGAEQVEFVEISVKHCRLINAHLIKHSKANFNAHVWREDVLKTLPRLNPTYDIIFADPPYAMDCLDKLANAITTHKLLNRKGVFIFEHSSTQLNPPILPNGLVQTKFKKYGDSAISIYRFESEQQIV